MVLINVKQIFGIIGMNLFDKNRDFKDKMFRLGGYERM
jgi:hypothetical protein